MIRLSARLFNRHNDNPALDRRLATLTYSTGTVSGQFFETRQGLEFLESRTGALPVPAGQLVDANLQYVEVFGLDHLPETKEHAVVFDQAVITTEATEADIAWACDGDAFARDLYEVRMPMRADLVIREGQDRRLLDEATQP